MSESKDAMKKAAILGGAAIGAVAILPIAGTVGTAGMVVLGAMKAGRGIGESQAEKAGASEAEREKKARLGLIGGAVAGVAGEAVLLSMAPGLMGLAGAVIGTAIVSFSATRLAAKLLESQNLLKEGGLIDQADKLCEQVQDRASEFASRLFSKRSREEGPKSGASPGM